MPTYLGGGVFSENSIKRSVCLRQLCSITACTRSKQARVSATLHAWREEDKWKWVQEARRLAVLHSPSSSVFSKVLLFVVVIVARRRPWWCPDWTNRLKRVTSNGQDSDGQAERVDTATNHVFQIRLNQQEGSEGSSIVTSCLLQWPRFLLYSHSCFARLSAYLHIL